MNDATIKNVIEVNNISKQYKNDMVVKSVNLTVPEGALYGIFGENGSGKSVLLKTVCGFVTPTSGYVKVFGDTIGKDVDFPRNTGMLIERPGFLPGFSAKRNLSYLASIRGIISEEEVDQAIQRVGLDKNNKKPVKTYSTGMLQRLGIAQAIMEKPKLLILDEPTTAVDKEGRGLLYDLFTELRQQGTTILLTSHIVYEIEPICEKVFEMDQGELNQV